MRKARKSEPAALQPPTNHTVHKIEPTAVYSREDVVRIFRIKLSTIRREVGAGRLRVSKRAGRYYFMGARLIEWLQGGEVPPAGQAEGQAF